MALEQEVFDLRKPEDLQNALKLLLSDEQELIKILEMSQTQMVKIVSEKEMEIQTANKRHLVQKKKKLMNTSILVKIKYLNGPETNRLRQ